MKAAADFILGLSLASVTTPNPAEERGKEDRAIHLNTVYRYHGKAVLAFTLGLIVPLYVNPFFSVIKPSLLGESS